MGRPVSDAPLRRIAQYLFYLKSLPDDGPALISASMIADALHYGDVLVRKDLAAVSGPGKNKTGRIKKELIADLEDFLGLNQKIRAVYFTDRTGALPQWRYCDSFLTILSVAVISPRETVFSPEALKELCHQMDIRVGIIDVAPDQLETALNTALSAGIETIWNISSAPIYGPEGVMIYNEVLNSSLVKLSRRLRIE